MIKSVNLKQLTKHGMFPSYVYNNSVEIYTLMATVAGGYEIPFAKLTIGKSLSGNEILSHALFESYTDHGEKMSEAKARSSGYEREFNSVM